MIDPSSLLFLHDHFETNPDYDFTDDHFHMILPYFPVLKNAGHAQLCTCIAKFGYLTESDANTGYESKEFDKITCVDNDTMLINDPNHDLSDFSKTTNENAIQFEVLRMFEFSIFHVSHDHFTLWVESKESMQSGNRCQRERESNRRKRRFCEQRCRINVKGTVLV